jgi:hypothetical protein
MREEKQDIIAVQETHAVYEENLRRGGTIQGYILYGGDSQQRSRHLNIC